MDLNDAFKQLDCLTEDVFEVTDDGIQELKDFKDNDVGTDVIEIADLDAETEDDLEDNYIGKVICQCDVCKSLIYCNKEEIAIDEDSEDVVNVGEECPYCFSSSGYKIIGEVVPFSGFQVDAKDEDGEPVDVEVTVNGEDIPQEKQETNENLCPECHKEPCECDKEDENFDYTPAEDLEALSLRRKHESFRGRELRRIKRYDESLDSIKLDDGNQEIEIKTKEKEVDDEEDGMIVPPSDETIEDIYSDEIAEDEVSDEDIQPEDGDEVEADVGEIEEESFNRLGESYLKKVYGNVKSFEVTEAYAVDNKIKLEGIISFKSGKTKNTSFIFEAATINARGNIKFIGENRDISRGKKSFSVSGALRHGKFFPESFTYNYRTKSLNESKSTRVYGTVKL